MKHLDLFSGIGGFALAAEMVWKDIEHIFVEYDPFCQAVLKKHWPTSEIHGDIKEYRGGYGPIDLITGGFPCQPFSNAGERRGTRDDRHLWPEMLRVIREVHPRWIIGENVDGLITWDRGMVLENIISDLESSGYEAQCFTIPAAAVDAPHRRDRIWILANRASWGLEGRAVSIRQRKSHETASNTDGSSEDVSNAERVRQQKNLIETSGRASRERSETANKSRRRSGALADADGIHGQGRNTEESQRRQGARRQAGLRSSADRRFTQWPAEPAVGRVAHGISNRVDRIKALGNAIVPQVAAEIMRAIAQADSLAQADLLC